MGFYLRKSFRAGPFRFNLSKSGIGVSTGVKGARVGVGPRGSYVHAGRHGLYYRKNLSSNRSRVASDLGGDGLAVLLICVGAIVLAFWLAANPAILVAVVCVAIGAAVVLWSIKAHRKLRFMLYKNALDSALVESQSPPSTDILDALRRQQETLPRDLTTRERVQRIEADVYQAVLDKVLDDGHVTTVEAVCIGAAETILRVEPDARLRIKKEIFSAAYVESIQDRSITQSEIDKFKNLIAGLGIPPAEVEPELAIVREILGTQKLRLPFKPIPRGDITANVQKSEDVFYQCAAQVLSKHKTKLSTTGYGLTVRRLGTMVLTNKRILVEGGGSTIIRYDEIADLDVDIDEGVIEITKKTSGRPIILKVEAPIYSGRAIDLLMNA